MTKYLLHILILVICLSKPGAASPLNYTIHSLNVTPPGVGPIVFQAIISTMKLGLEHINNSTTILPNTKLIVENFAHYGSAAIGVSAMMNYAAQNVTFVMGNFFADVSAYTAIVGDVFNIAQLSGFASSPNLSNDLLFPLYSRITYSGQGDMIRETIRYYASIQGPRGWDAVAVISTTDVYGVSISQDFIENIGDDISIASYQQYLLEDELTQTISNIDLELREIKRSGARIIVAIAVSGHEQLLKEAKEEGLLGEAYVWFLTDTVLGAFLYTESAGELSQGILATFQDIPKGTPELQAFRDLWYSLDPEMYPGTGPGSILSPYFYLVYDMMLTAGNLVHEIDKQGLLDSGEHISGQKWNTMLRSLEFNGTSGVISFNSNGDRLAPYSIQFYDASTNEWIVASHYSDAEGYEHIEDIIWYSNTTTIPDLDIREPFDYWSCHNKELRNDPTGKQVSLHTPDGSDIDDIDSSYHCDHFIDCKNLSDESFDCASNYTGIFIAFGIVTGICVLVCILLLVFVVVFGLGFQYRRLRVASPYFLLLLLISMIVGYCSIYAWFGKPNAIACGFQPWLLGLSSISMIAALCAKNYRIWRIFKRKMTKQIITDFELLILWVIIMLPALVILIIWTIVSTPTAKIEQVDGNDHFICTSGGVTGKPGGIIFFFILVAYGSIVLLLGVFLSVVTRKVPSLFNESKLLAISIYNIGFLSAVVIPVFLVIQPINPFIAWIIRTAAILYAFTATLVLQFAPPIIGIFVMDKGKNIKIFKSNLTQPPSSPISNLSTSPQGTLSFG